MKRMNKLLWALVGLALSGAVMAETCTTDLRNRNGLLINSFDGWGYTMNEACRESRRECLQELEWRLRSGSYPGAYCEDQNRGPYDPTPRQYRCFANMNRGNGAHIASFRGLSNFSQQQACTEALRDCQGDLRRRQSRGQNPRAYCEIDRVGNPGPRPGPGNPPGGVVTVACSAELLGPAGRVRRVLTATAQGRRADQSVRRIACERAMKQCQAVRNARQSCRIRR